MVRICIVAGLAIGTGVAEGQLFRGWYDAGGTYIQETELRSFAGEAVAGNKVEFDPGFRAGVGIGQDVSRFVAIELEGGFHYNSVKTIGGATETEAAIYQVPVLANVVLRFPNRTRITPSVGGGAGAVYSILDADSIVIGATRYAQTDETWEFAYQGYAALRYEYAENLSIGLSYHVLVNDSPGWNRGSGLVKFDNLINHSVSLTFGFGF